MSRGAKIVLAVVGTVVVLVVVGRVIAAREGGEVAVRMEPVSRRDLVSAVTASGHIEAKSQVDVQSEVTARILKIHVEEGDIVKKGQLLIELDQVQFKGTVDRAEAGLAAQQASLVQAKANRDQAKRALDRDLELKRVTPNLISDQDVELSQQQYDVSQALYQASQAQVEQSKATVKEAKDNLARTMLYAPMSGKVVRLAVEEGEVAQTGTFSRDVGLLMTIADLSVIQANVKVDETDVVRLALGDSASVDIDAFPDTSFVGRVTKIANSASAVSAAGQSADRAVDFEVEITLDNPPADVRPDLSMTARIVTDTRKDALSIPIIALTARDQTAGGDVVVAQPLVDTATAKVPQVEGVFVVKDGIARFRPTKVGIAGDEYFEVLSGVTEGDTVVSGSYQAIRDLKDSTRVKRIDQPAAPKSGI